MPSCSNGASESEMDRCWRTSASSKSLTVLPSSTRPARGIVPVATRRASTSVVLPAPEWPTSTTLRIRLGLSTVGALPTAAPAGLDLSAMAALLVRPDADPFCADDSPPAGGAWARPQSPRSVFPARYPRRTMLGIHGRPQIGKVTEPLARRLVAMGVTPDALTIVGTIGVAGGALGFYPRGKFFLGTLVITAFVFSDLLDGAVARVRGTTGAWGAFLDSTCDRIGDGAVFGALALWYAGDGNSITLCAVALYDLVAGVVTSYAKARAESLGLTCNVGIAERSERLIAILVLTGLSGLFDVPELRTVALWGLAGATTVTVVQRMVEVRRQTRPAGASPAAASPASASEPASSP